MRFVFLRGKVLPVCLVPVLSAGLCVPAFGQTLTGDYKIIGRRCEDSKLLVPPAVSTQTLSFRSDGSFQHSLFVIDVPTAAEGEMTIEENQERRRERRTAQFLRYFEDDKKQHERDCIAHGTINDENGRDLCSPRQKEKLYGRWRSERIAEAEKELAREEKKDRRGIAAQIRECSKEIGGRYTARGNRLTLFPEDFFASEDCSKDESYPLRSTMTYYFEGEFLYLVRPADRLSEKHCGFSDWAEIYFGE